MVKEITITNAETGEQILIGEESTTLILDMIYWDSPSVSPDTYRVPYQVGTTLAGVVVGNREPMITGYVIADVLNIDTHGMTWEEYYTLQETEINQTKSVLNRILSVYQDVLITTGEYTLRARPSKPVVYSENERENNEVLCLFQIYLTAYKPLFYKENKIYNLASVEPRFKFPFFGLDRKNLVFGIIQQRQSISVQNDGEAPVGCVITIRALVDNVKDPNIYNVVTGEYITLEDITLLKGDTVTINTEKGEESVIKHTIETGEDRNIIGNLKKGSTLFQIEQGERYYSYTLEEGNIGSVEISISFREQFFNIENM